MWKQIDGYDYEVNQLGNVRRIGGETLKPRIHDRGRGYPVVDLYRDGVRYRCYVHIIVAKAFIPNPDNLPIVNHIDGDTRNPKADNLEWVSVARNTEHAYEMGLNSKAISCELVAPDGSRKVFHSMRSLSTSLGRAPTWLAETSRRRGRQFSYNGAVIVINS